MRAGKPLQDTPWLPEASAGRLGLCTTTFVANQSLLLESPAEAAQTAHCSVTRA